MRRIWISKPGKPEKRPLGIPTMADRARQALVKLALEPQWEAQFEPNSYGFRPARSSHDAVSAIFKAISLKTAYVLDADISGCFDHIDHKTLLQKLIRNHGGNRISKIAGRYSAGWSYISASREYCPTWLGIWDKGCLEDGFVQL